MSTLKFLYKILVPHFETGLLLFWVDEDNDYRPLCSDAEYDAEFDAELFADCKPSHIALTRTFNWLGLLYVVHTLEPIVRIESHTSRANT